MEGDGADKQPNNVEHAPAPAAAAAGQGAADAAAAQKKYSERKDSASWVYSHWEPCSPEEDGPKRKYRCKYSDQIYRHNVTRMRNHLLNCNSAPEEVRQKAQECCDQISERKTAKDKEKKSRGDEAGSPSSKKRKGFDAEARGLIADAKKIDSKDANNKFGRALASLKLEPESVNNEKLKQFIKSIAPSYDYPDEAEMKTIWVTLKLTHETFDSNGNE
eukprot:CAMPEP_0197486976 /NCGR_PEP_ID=MMETSP1311-20131121/1974_1 /TAXON_ID=464262 /ORGANISM="Genus nov. species nov., Strain RCC856" /LENGTH=217 /DNA_ID=CAMNT_0043030391 /DNA_START=112 /DNA_END=765 /DNA_ORIENTATION=+